MVAESAGAVGRRPGLAGAPDNLPALLRSIERFVQHSRSAWNSRLSSPLNARTACPNLFVLGRSPVRAVGSHHGQATDLAERLGGTT